MRQAREWCQTMNRIPYYETSAKKAVNVSEAFQCIATKGLERARTDISRFNVDQMANIRLDRGRGSSASRSRARRSMC